MGSTKFVSRPRFEDYKEKFKEYIVMERKNGIILLRMHTNGGHVKWNLMIHNALCQAWHEIGNDPENEVMILTSTGSVWIAESDETVNEGMEVKEGKLDLPYERGYYDSTKLVENLVFDVDIPTIGAVNGPGFHTEIALLCDITICTEKAQFQDAHFSIGFPPGDGQGLVFQELLGLKRAAYYLYTGKNIDAKTAFEWGLVNEVVSEGKLLNRAWEIAEMIMKQSRVNRRMTSQILRRPWKRLLINDFQVHLSHELYGIEKRGSVSHDFEAIRKSWEK